MVKKAVQNQHPEGPPAWYWMRGLHDAHVILTEAFEFPFDYNCFTKEKNRYDRNCLTLTVDASGAIFDTSVKSIRLYNYKYLTDSTLLEERGTLWWISDRLTVCDDHYELEIDFQDSEHFPKDFTVKIKFDRAEVDR
jgi:hypothetical protein